MIDEYKKLQIREQILLCAIIAFILYIAVEANIIEDDTVNDFAKIFGTGTIIILFASPLTKLIIKLRECKLKYYGRFYWVNYMLLFFYKLNVLNSRKKIIISIFKLEEKKAIYLGMVLHRYFNNYKIEYLINEERSNCAFLELNELKNEYNYVSANSNIIAFLNTYIDDNKEKLMEKPHMFISKNKSFLNIDKITEINNIVSTHEELVFLCSGRVYLNVQLGKYIQMLIKNKRTKKVSVLIFNKIEGGYNEHVFLQ